MMKQSIHAMTMRAAFKTAGGQHYRRETVHRLESDYARDEREAASDWLRHVEAGRIGPHLSGSGER